MPKSEPIWHDLHKLNPILNMRLNNARTVADYLDAFTKIGVELGFTSEIRPDADHNNISWHVNRNERRRR